jgi:hypothetical protein
VADSHFKCRKYRGGTSLATENARKAYELRDRVSERERFYIESHYTRGDLEKARQISL